MMTKASDGAAEGDADASLHATLVERLRQLLIEGELASGRRIPEAELCERFNVSRTPLREALKVLASEGYLQLRPNRGAIVAPLNVEEIAPIFEVKGALERLIGLKIVEEATEAELAEIQSLHDRLGAALAEGDLNGYTQINYLFHRAFAQATHNPVLIQSYDALQQKIWRFRFLVNECPARLQASLAEHEAIMVALLARTPLDLAARLAAHNTRTCAAMIASVRSVTSDPSQLA